MAPGCHCLALSLVGRQLLHFWAGLAHSHGAPARRAPSYGTGLPLPAAADTGRLCPLARRPPARRAPSYGTGLPLPAAADTGRLCPLARRRRAPSDGTGLPLPCAPLVGVAAASLLTRAGFVHSHTYMPGHGAPARAVAAFLAGSNSLPPVLAMSSAGD